MSRKRQHVANVRKHAPSMYTHSWPNTKHPNNSYIHSPYRPYIRPGAHPVNGTSDERPDDLSKVMAEMQKPENAYAFFVLPSQFNGVEFPSHCILERRIYGFRASSGCF